ncbi:MAG: acyl-CoA dehydrogenase family protein [Pseudomonadota bacterium]
MKLSLDTEQQMLKDSVERFVADNWGVDERRRLRDAGELVNPDTWRQMAELGWCGLPFSEDLGGYGGSFADIMVLMEGLGKGLAAQPFLTSVLACGGLLARGDQAVAGPLLNGLISGEVHGALAFAEQRGRFHLDRVATLAEPSEGGAVLLEGEKIAVAGGAEADFLLVTARHAADASVNLYVVADPTLTERRQVPLVDGSSGAAVTFRSTPAKLLLANCVPDLEAVVDELLVAMGSQALGCMQALLDLTVEYTKTREQFGQPIGKFQALQHRMADMYMHCEALRSLLYQAVIAHEEDRPDKSRVSSALKVKLGEAGRFVSQQAVQLHGGIGMSDELAVSHHFKSLMLLNTLFGDPDYHLDRYRRLAA